jgi:hypothetical protein
VLFVFFSTCVLCVYGKSVRNGTEWNGACQHVLLVECIANRKIWALAVYVQVSGTNLTGPS